MPNPTMTTIAASTTIVLISDFKLGTVPAFVHQGWPVAGRCGGGFWLIGLGCASGGDMAGWR